MERLKVLVVDDESRMRKLVRDFLVKKDFEVLEAGDGEQAIDIFFEKKDIALVILDVMMRCSASSSAWTSIFPSRSARRFWSRAWRRSCAGQADSPRTTFCGRGLSSSTRRRMR